jgi:hypothetical protein
MESSVPYDVSRIIRRKSTEVQEGYYVAIILTVKQAKPEASATQAARRAETAVS